MQVSNIEQKTFSVVVRFCGVGEIIDSVIVDSTSRSGASRKANTIIGRTYFAPIKKVRLDNYEYWDCEEEG